MWFVFFLDAILIILAGSQLTKNAAKIARGLGLSSAWAGALLLPLATSLPELTVTIRAVAIDAPDLAGGNIYGSTLFNLSLLALIDLLQGRGPLTARRKRSLIFTAHCSMLMLTFSALGIFLSLPYRLGWVGLDTIVLLLLFLLGSGMIIKMESGGARQHLPAETKNTKNGELFRGLIYFVLASMVIVWAGTDLTDTADLIARETGWSKTLVGSFLVGITTSLPEIVTTMTAVHLGLAEMAIANVFGANFFDLMMLFIADLFYRQGPLLSFISPQNLIIALMSIILTLLAVISLTYPFRRHLFRMGIPSFLIIVGYLLTLVFLS